MKLNDDLDRVERQWTRLGAGFAGEADVPTPDLERLILDTARWAPLSPRLMNVAVTWLSRYASLIAEHRLAALVEEGELEDEHLPALGLLLDAAVAASGQHDRIRNLERAKRLCSPAATPRPFFEVEQGNAVLESRAERRASDLSRNWNLWCEPLQAKLDALRPPAWLIAHNPVLAFRADFRGDLRATILLTLRAEPDAGRSVSELGRRCHASRTAVINALSDLQLGCHVSCRREGKCERVEPAA